VSVSHSIRRLLHRLRARLADERGSVTVIVIACLPLMMAATVLAVDLGTLRVDRQRAQMAADAAALAGAGDTSNGMVVATTAKTDADHYVQSNDPDATDVVTPDYRGDASSVRVDVSQTVPLSFAKLFGISTKPISASAVASDELSTPLGYFGEDRSDIQDGSKTSDGWDNFCAIDGATSASWSATGTTNSWSSGDAQGAGQSDSDPMRCVNETGLPAPNTNLDAALDFWQVAHGGIDVAQTTQFSSPNTYSDDGTTDDQMVDLTGSCVEAVGTYPSAAQGNKDTVTGNNYTSITINGINTHDNGSCENNADGEIEEAITTQPNAQYTVTFWLGANTWGYPLEKSLMAVASDTDLESLPPMADTRGVDDTSGKDTTMYPLESNAAWTGSGMRFRGEYFEWIPSVGSNAITVPWTKETFQFTADAHTTYVGFGSLDNCAPDWTPNSQVNNTSSFYTTGATGTSNATASIAPITGSSWVKPPVQVHDYDDGSNWEDQCFYGPGISDVRVTGPGNIALTQ
jgi:hypothetical protein